MECSRRFQQLLRTAESDNGMSIAATVIQTRPGQFATLPVARTD